MKTINAKITMLINRDCTDIEIKDEDSITILARIQLTPEQLSAMLSRQSYVKCESCEVGNLDRIGKKHENKQFEFEITYTKAESDLELACKEALFQQEMFGWIPDNYYGSQGSFFKKDGKDWARVTIRRWI